MTRWVKASGAFLGVCLALGAAGVYAVGSVLTAPVPREIGPPPEDLRAETVAIPSASGADLAAWFVPVDSVAVDSAGEPVARGSVVLMHGVRADRNSLTDRARLFRDAGYAVLLFDFQAHGESAGEKITFGWRERHDAIAATRWMRQRLPDAPLAVVGQSMGGAAAVLAGADLDADALVLESVYASIHQATENRLTMRLGAIGAPLAPLLTAQFPVRLGVPADSIAPEAAIGRLSIPVLIASGTEDEHATVAEARALYANAPDPKTLWLASGAAHQDLYAFAPETYRERVLGWLSATLAR